MMEQIKELKLKMPQMKQEFWHQLIIRMLSVTKKLSLIRMITHCEYADGGNLQEYIEYLEESNKLMPEDEALHIFVQIVKGLSALHSLKIIHRDLKSANVFMTKKKQIKIGDMNVAKILKGQFGSTQTGTPYYAGPEIWLQTPQYLAVDIWSLGCILFEMLSYYPPFNGDDMKLLANSIVHDQPIDIPLEFSQDINRLIKKLLMKNPLKRPNCSQILEYEIIQSYLNNQPSLYQQYENLENRQVKSKLAKTIKQPKDFYFMNTGDFPEKNYAKKIEDASNQRDQKTEGYILDWKFKKRQRQDIVKKFRFVGLDDVRVPFKKINQYEEEIENQKYQEEKDVNDYIIKKRNHRRVEKDEKQLPIFTHKVGILIDFDSRKKPSKQSGDNNDQNYREQELSKEASMSYQFGYRDRFLDQSQSNIQKPVVKIARFRDEDQEKRIKINMYQGLNIGIKSNLNDSKLITNDTQAVEEKNENREKLADYTLKKRNSGDFNQLSNIKDNFIPQKKRAISRTIQNINQKLDQDTINKNIQHAQNEYISIQSTKEVQKGRSLSPFVKSGMTQVNSQNQINKTIIIQQSDAQQLKQYQDFREMGDYSSNILDSISRAYSNQKPVYYNVKQSDQDVSRNQLYHSSIKSTRTQSDYQSTNKKNTIDHFSSDTYGQRLKMIQKEYIF
ncbi:protein kinase domain containing protein [Stylonychia lemnae]|uniref:non-specific serine/threonine protein kinase n=1 Tax=Stylonychia lemnae TaxID=5949 RepID=A0A078A5Q4_STYLE|nr:protein kinase domain containing protein [Stylonychia lemnae]|eukprot:CDW76875.1 protein kinase domain containing protein [Stylonychia lemnae]